MASNIVIIYSAFDHKIGQVPLLYKGIDEETAKQVCIKVAMSILSVTKIASADTTKKIQGESFVPLVEENIGAFVYYFYSDSENLSEPSFSFLLYGVPLDQRFILYSNSLNLAKILGSFAHEIKNAVNLKEPLPTNTTIPEHIREQFNELYRPISELLKEEFKEVKTQLQESIDFIKGLAYVIFDPLQTEITVVYRYQAEEENIKNIVLRIMLSLLLRVSETKKEGEAVLPDFTSQQIIYSYFFFLDSHQKQNNLVGAFLVFSDTEKKNLLYRWAPVLSREFKDLTALIKRNKKPEKVSKELVERFNRIYYFDTIAEEALKQEKTISEEESHFIKNPQLFFQLKRHESLLFALLSGQPIIIAAKYFSDAQALSFFLDKIAVHRDVILEKKPLEAVLNNPSRWRVYYISDHDLPKKIPKTVTVVHLGKKKVESPLNSEYIKRLSKQLKNKDLKEIISIIKNETEYLLAQVTQLVEYARMEDSVEAKKKIDDLILNLPDRESFDVIRELAISYNPVLADLIAERAVYAIRKDVWGF